MDLNPQEQADLLARGFSRRAFGRFASLMAAGAALPFYNEPVLAQLSNTGPIPAGAVKINANENPLGPCPEAVNAIESFVKKGGRYSYEETTRFIAAIAAQENLKASYVLPFAGSSDPLHRVVMAFTSPTRGFVAADPGYEAGFMAATFVGAKTYKIPLTPTHAHDVRAMAAADTGAGVLYVCNPNNPTGTLTPRADIEWLLENKPKGSVVLLDEAYIHFTDAQMCSDLVAADKDLILLRTFSKLYGMAGLRAGAAFGRPDLLARIKGYAAGALPVTGMVGATASLEVKTLVLERRTNLRAVREDVFAFLQKKNIGFVPGETNCFMLDAKRPAAEFIKAMQAENVYVGRVWPVWPTFSRITVGTTEEMARFKAAVEKVMGASG
jgi:histidinol-phosphate aminotransferase